MSSYNIYYLSPPIMVLISSGQCGVPSECVYSPFLRPFVHLTWFLLAVLVTVDMPSTNLVLKSTLALLNMPSFRDTTMN